VTPRRVLPVGPPKTGTTYLQGLIAANREALGEAGVTPVGTHDEHFRAANELMGRPGRRGESVPEGAVDHVLGLLAATPGTAVASCERYSMLDGLQAKRLCAAIETHELHVVATLRDAVQVLPGQWQELVKNGADLTWEEFCERLVAEPKYRARLTRVRRVLRSWPEAVPPERLHVVTVPPPGSSRTALRDRFCEVFGVDPTVLGNDPDSANESVDLAGAELVRRLNEEAPVPPQVQHAEIKQFLVPEVLARMKAGPPPRLAGDAFEAARAESERHVVLVRRGGFPVVGDLDDLVAAEPPAGDPDAQHVDDAEVAELAVAAVAALARRSYERADREPAGRLRTLAGRVRRALGRVAGRPARRGR
jgi:hypothetical protein